MLSLLELSNQLSCIDMLQAIYCLPGELATDASDAEAVEKLRDFLETSLSPSAAAASSSDSYTCLPDAVNMTLRVQSTGHESEIVGKPKSVQLCIAIPLTTRGASLAHPLLSLRCPDWLDRKTHVRLLEDCTTVLSVPEDPETDGTEYVTRAVDHLQTVLPKYLTTATASIQPPSGGHVSSMTDYPSVLRVWYWLPSLSTKSKRADLVTYASSSTKDDRPPLTGFVLAGKPGIICLESSLVPAASPSAVRAASAQIDTYWRRIKTESWSDIPSAHKKVSERMREECVPRAFGKASPADGPGIIGATGMVEVTGMLRESMRGHKSNRGDLSVLVRWIDGPDGEGGIDRRLGTRLEKVLGAEWTADSVS